MDLSNLTPEELEQLRKEFAGGHGKLFALPPSTVVEIRWPGHISREELAQYCRETVLALGPENDGLIKAMANSKGLSDEEYEALHVKYSSNMGRQMALFDLMKWAENHNKSEEEMQQQMVDKVKAWLLSDANE